MLVNPEKHIISGPVTLHEFQLFNHPKTQWFKKTHQFYISHFCRSGVQMGSPGVFGNHSIWGSSWDDVNDCELGQPQLARRSSLSIYGVCLWLVWAFSWHGGREVFELLTQQLTSFRAIIGRQWGEQQVFISVTFYWLQASLRFPRRDYTREQIWAAWVTEGVTLGDCLCTRVISLWWVTIAGPGDGDPNLPGMVNVFQSWEGLKLYIVR